MLVVHQDEITVTHFLRVAREEMDRDRVGVKVPLSVTHKAGRTGGPGAARTCVAQPHKRKTGQALARP